MTELNLIFHQIDSFRKQNRKQKKQKMPFSWETAFKIAFN